MENGIWVVANGDGTVFERFGYGDFARDAALLSLASYPGCHVERRPA